MMSRKEYLAELDSAYQPLPPKGPVKESTLVCVDCVSDTDYESGYIASDENRACYRCGVPTIACGYLVEVGPSVSR